MATKGVLHELRIDLKEEFHELRADWKEELHELRADWREELHELRAELKDDRQAFMREVDGKMYAFQLTVHTTLNDFRRDVDHRFSAIDHRFSATDRKIDELGSTFNTKLERQSRKATIGIIGYMTFLAAVLGVVNALTG